MAFYYVKLGGTATGDAGRYATQQTGTFAALGASGYYNDILDAIAATTTPAAGDFILVSNLHSYTQNSAINYNPGVAAYRKIPIWSVNDTDIETYLAGAKEATGGTVFSMTFSGNMHSRGVDFESNYFMFNASDSQVTIEDANLTINAELNINTGGSKFDLLNTDVLFDSATGNIAIASGTELHMYGGSVKATGGVINQLTQANFTSGGATVVFNGTDVSEAAILIGDVGGGGATDDAIGASFYKCKINSSVTWHNEPFSKSNQIIEAYDCFTTGSGMGFVHVDSYTGTIDQNETIIRDETGEFPDTTKISLECITNTFADKGNPLVVENIARYYDLTSVDSDTIRIYLASTTTLTDEDFYAAAVYENGTAGLGSLRLSTIPATINNGTELTADTGSTWLNGASDLTGYNEYYLDIDTSGSPGAGCVPTINAYITTPSVTVFVCPTPGKS